MKRSIIRIAAACLLAALLLTAPAFAATVGGATVTASDVRLRADANLTSAILTEMQEGTFLLVEERLDGWYKVVWNGTEGYVSADLVRFSESAEGSYGFSAATLGTDVNLRAGASTSSAVVKRIAEAGSALTVTGVNGQWLLVTDAAGAAGYIRSDLAGYKSSQSAARGATTQTASADTGESLAQTAQLYRGYAYRWGGTSPATGFDCSGFVNYICSQYGVSLNRTAQDIYLKDGAAVSKSELQPGDILCFGYGPYSITHVGIYVGDGQMIHASTSATGVVYSDINSSYYTRMYVGAKRIV